jgi:beta-galactosidase
MLAAAVLGCSSFAFGQAYTPPVSPRATYNFNPGWKLQVGDPTNAHLAGFDDSAWKNVTLPRAWNEDDAFRVSIGSLPTGIAWYRKHLVLPPGSDGKKAFLEFEGIRHGGEFYVNGQWIGRHENGIMAAGFDVTPYLLPYPQENVVAVRIDNSYSYHEVATGSTFQWNSTSFYANYGGINKNVKLHLSGKAYQTLPLYSNLGTVGTYIYAQGINVPGKSAVIHADAQVRNEDLVERTLNCDVVVVDTNGVALASFTGAAVTIPPGQTNVLTASSLVTNLNFWSWGYGYLYDVYTIVRETNTVLDVVRTRTGFRKTQFTDGMVRLNDRVINVHGFAQRSTDEWPAIGCSVPSWLNDFSQRMVVDGGGNNMRWMHVTPGKQIIEACDRQGLMQAMPAGDSEGDVSDRRWDQRKEVMRDAIIYNRNNPSIIFYESGNDGISEAHMIQMKAIRDQYDPFGGRAIGCREMMGSTNAEWGGEMLYLNKSATKPMWMTEYSRDEDLRRYWDNYSPPYHQNGDYVHRNQDSMAIETVLRWDDCHIQRPGTGTRVNSGGAKIVFSDSNTHYRGNQNYRGSGVVDPLRLPKDSWFVHQVMWDGWVDVERVRAHIIGHWNYTNGVVKDIYVASTAAYVELFSNGTSLGYGTKSYDFLFTWPNVVWEPGTLEAVGYASQGAQVCADTRVTAGPAHAIRLTPMFDPTGWKADGHDLALYEVEVVDAQGRRCPTNFNLVSFALSGPVEWRGGLAARSDDVPGDNYILSTNLPVECGVNRVLVRSTTNAGTVVLTATSPGLISATTNLNTIAFAVTNGLAASLPGEGLPASYARGPTPSTPSYVVSRVAVTVTNITAGAPGTGAFTNTIDDNEATSWTSSSTLGQNWIQYALARTALVSQVVLKFTQTPRDDSYPLSVAVNGTTLYTGTPPTSLGYLTLNLTPTVGNSLRISGTSAASFPLMEVEIYEAVIDGTPPAAPNGLSATPVGSTQINLAWTDNATNELEFTVEHSTDGVSFAGVVTLPPNATGHSDMGLMPNATYHYRVRASNHGGDSANATATAATLVGPPAVPTGLTAVPGDEKVTLNWSSSAGATNYILLRSTTNGGPYSPVGSTFSTSFVNTNLANGTNYFYVLAAVGPYGQSSYSAQVSAAPVAGLAGVYWINTITAAAQGWNANSNWSNGTGFPNTTLLPANVTANIAANQTVSLNQPITLGALSLGASGGSYTIAGNGGALTFDNAPDDALLVQVAASKGDTISAAITNNIGLTIQNNSANPLTLSGGIAGSGNVTVNGNLNLSAAGVFGGDTILNGGTLLLSNTLALQNSTLNYDGGSLVFSGITTATLGGLSGTRDLSLVNAAASAVALTLGGNNSDATYLGDLSGAGSLTKAGTGTQTLSGTNTYAGNTTIVGGNLTIRDGTLITPGRTILVGNGATGIAFNIVDGTVAAGTLNVATVANSTGDRAYILGSASAAFTNVNLGSSANTSGPLTIDTTGTVALGAFIDFKDLQGNGPSTSSGLIISNGTVTADSVIIQNTGSGANLNISGGSLTIGSSSSTNAFRIGNGGSVRGGFLTMSGGSLTYLGTDGLLLATVSGTVASAYLNGGTATLRGITLNKINAAGLSSSLSLGSGATLYLGNVGLVANQPSATVFVSLGGGIVGAFSDWSSTAPMTLTGNTTFKAADAAGGSHNISLAGVLSGSGGLTKSGGGLLTLSGTNTYTGTTTISEGTLAVSGILAGGSTAIVGNGGVLRGTGTIHGPATIQSGGVLSPGASVGTLTFSNSLALAAGCTNVFEISKSPTTNDVARVFGALTNGGTLVVTNISGNAIAAGDSFKLLNAVSYSGAFNNVILPPLNSGLAWSTSTLSTAGEISVVSRPQFTGLGLGSSGLVASGTGGQTNGSYFVLTTTNLTLPAALWVRAVTNAFDAAGGFAFTNPIDPTAPQRYYRLQLP